MKCRAFILFALIIVCSGQTVPGSSPASTPSLANLLKQLAAEDFSTRQEAQNNLDALPSSQIEALRAAAKSSADPEVKTRLLSRIDFMEFDILTHPSGLTVHLKDATIADLAAALNRQLGKTLVVVSNSGPGRIRIDAENRPFWEIIKQADAQVPLALATVSSITPEGMLNQLQLTPEGNVPHDLRIVGPFAITPSYLPARNLAPWSIRFALHSDPRVALCGFTVVEVAKIDDKDGNSLLNAVAVPRTSVSLVKPTLDGSVGVGFERDTPVTAIKELRGTSTIKIVQSERVIAVDLTAESPAAVDSPVGKLTIGKSQNHPFLIIGNAEKSDAISARLITVQTFDKAGKLLVTASVSANSRTELTWNDEIPAKLLVTTVDKTRDYVLPIELTNFDPTGKKGGAAAESRRAP